MTVIVNTPQELITVSKYAGIDIKLSEISVCFPYYFEIKNERTTTIPFADFFMLYKNRYL
jgi:hypothetical protein